MYGAVRNSMLVALALLLAGCHPQASGAVASATPNIPTAPPKWALSEDGKRTLVVWNRQTPDGERLARYYASQRGLPPENIIRINVLKTEDTAKGEFDNNVVPVLHERIDKSPTPIDFIVLTKGIPIKVYDTQAFAFDALVAAMDIKVEPMRQLSEEGVKRAANPYYGKSEPFSHKKFGLYLVTRLDGYTYEDAVKLIDNSMKAKGDKGPFFADSVEKVNNDGYGLMNASMISSGEILKKKGFDITVDRTADFVLPPEPLMGYVTWGSNDAHYSHDTYSKVRFKPGAIGETFVSTSGRTLKPVTSGQSVVTDLIAQGISGVKGYVEEPYTVALARPHILFDRYVSGYNLAESFYMASPMIKWKDIVFGDALCRPYKK